MVIVSEVLEIDVLFVVILLTLFLYYHVTKTFNHFEDLDVKYIKPLPYFGNTIRSMLNQRHVVFCHKEVYDETKGEDYVGFFQNRTPFLMIRNPQLIQTVIVKDFNHFYNRGRNIDERLDPLRAYSLVNLAGQKWKSLRQKLTPAFSTGKLKLMMQQFNDCGEELLNYFKANEEKPIDVGEAMAKYSTDVIGTCAFGLQFNSLKDPNSHFRRVGQDLSKESFGSMIKPMLEAIHTRLPFLFNIRTFDKEHNDFFMNFVKDTIKYRKENNVERNDFIQILMNIAKQDEAMTAENNNKQKFLKEAKELNENFLGEKSNYQIIFDDKVLAANTFVFFIAGFETTASTLRSCLFELSLSHNACIQNKLRKEILTTVKKHDNKVMDDTIKDMPYMDCVISETLRKYPPVGALVRVCTKPYNIPGTSVFIKEGQRVLIPVYSIHHDPEYYPEPDLFDPERFNEENKLKRPDYAHLPFGDGPRVCIGSRFALLEVKTALTKILLNYEITLNERTQLPLRWMPRKLLLCPQQPIFLNFKMIKEQFE